MTASEEVTVINEVTLHIFIWAVFDVVCQGLNLFGIVTNIINIVCFQRQGFADSANISLLGLAVSDLGSLVTMLWTCIFMSPALTSADLTFEPLEVAYLTSGIAHFSFTRVSSCITALITIERCMCITFPLKVKSLITSKRVGVITTLLFILFFSTSAPFYVVNSLGEKFSTFRNKTLIGLISSRDREHVEKLSFVINNFTIPFCSFVVIVVCTAIISFKLRVSTELRHTMRSSTQSDNVSNRSQKAAKMVVMISTLFIICFVPVNINMIAIGFIPELSVGGKYVSVSIIITGLGYVLESVNSSMNIFIYYHMSSRYREQLCKLLPKRSKQTKH